MGVATVLTALVNGCAGRNDGKEAPSGAGGTPMTGVGGTGAAAGGSLPMGGGGSAGGSGPTGTGGTQAVDAPTKPRDSIACSGPLAIAGQGHVYLDGRYTGLDAPLAELMVPEGEHTVALASNDQGYLWKKLIQSSNTGEKCAVDFKEQDRMPPRRWRLLVVELRNYDVGDADCTVRTDDAEANSMMKFIKDNYADLEEDSYHTMYWEIDTLRVDDVLQFPSGEVVANLDHLDPGGPTAYVAPLAQMHSPDTGELYDLILLSRKTFGKTKGGADCDTRTGSWYGLGWWDFGGQAGANNYRFSSQELGGFNLAAGIDKMIASGNQNVVHEWYHTVERYYQDVPDECCTDFPIHNRADYGFGNNDGSGERDFQEVFFRGLVPAKSGGKFLGIGPEAAHQCTSRDRALAPERCASAPGSP